MEGTLSYHREMRADNRRSSVQTIYRSFDLGNTAEEVRETKRENESGWEGVKTEGRGIEEGWSAQR